MDAAAQWALVGSAAMLGLGGAVHCAAMCGPACAVVAMPSKGWLRAMPFYLGRVAGYALGGAIASGGFQWLAWASSSAPVLRPLWGLLHAAALAYGLWLLLTGRQPAFLASWGRQPVVAGGRGLQPAGALARAGGSAAVSGGGGGGWQVMQTPWSQAAAGTAWVAWPCGLLQSALLVAAMADNPATAATAMAVFAVMSTPGLHAGPGLAQWLLRRAGGSAAGPGIRPIRDHALRLAGLFLVMASAWALGHDLFRRAAELCFG
jgi:sulfite exporter TauE/SafE